MMVLLTMMIMMTLIAMVVMMKKVLMIMIIKKGGHLIIEMKRVLHIFLRILQDPAELLPSLWVSKPELTIQLRKKNIYFFSPKRSSKTNSPWRREIC